MSEKKTFTVWIRLYADGSQFSLTEQEWEDGVTFDDVVDTAVMEDTPFREFPISVTADLPTGDDVTVAASHADVAAGVAGTDSATAG